MLKVNFSCSVSFVLGSMGHLFILITRIYDVNQVLNYCLNNSRVLDFNHGDSEFCSATGH